MFRSYSSLQQELEVIPQKDRPSWWKILLFLFIVVAIFLCTALPVILQFHYPQKFGFPPAKKWMVENSANQE